MRNISNSRRAVTLVELLVVAAILVILIAILLPAIGMAREQSRSTVCQSKLRRFGTALNAYLTENGGSFPPYYWSKPLMLLIAGRSSPSDANFAPDETYKFQQCPSLTIPMKNKRGITYAANLNVFFNNGADQKPSNIARFRRVGQTIAIGDINQAYSDGGGWWHYDWGDWESKTAATAKDIIPVGADAGPLMLANTDSDGTTSLAGKVSGLRYRHGWNKSPTKGTANVLMLDAHVESIRGGELMEQNVIAKKY